MARAPLVRPTDAPPTAHVAGEAVAIGGAPDADLSSAAQEVPAHVAIIMDGNRRWAKDRGLKANDGHLAGYERLKSLGPECIARGITHLTVFAFSTENWGRPREEIDGFFDLLGKRQPAEVFKDLEVVALRQDVAGKVNPGEGLRHRKNFEDSL